MQFQVSSIVEKRNVRDALVIPFWKGEKGVLPACEASFFEEDYAPVIASGDFEAKVGECVCLWSKRPEEKRIFLLGLGSKEACTQELLRRSWSALTQLFIKKKIKTANILLPLFETAKHTLFARASLEGMLLGTYAFDKYRHDTLKETPSSHVECLTILTSEIHAIQELCAYVQKIIKAVFFARDLVNGCADDITPQYLGQVAQEMAKTFARVTVEVHGREWIEKQKMGLFLAVARGSAKDPVFICLHYNGNPVSNDRTILVGKGITFDTGGLNLKPTGSMEDMRSDMGGAAVCLGCCMAAAAINLECNLTVVIPACENMVDAFSYKPGDVYTSYTGKTVEITNTDAEGRLILADALAYAVRHLNPSRIIDVATLTGAMVIALGSEAIGFFSNSDFLAEELMQAGQKTHERVWRLPLFDEYKEKLKSDYADIKNAGGRQAGAILAALFLKEFISDTPWAHLDIAGVAYLSESSHYLPKHATGIGVRLLIEFLESQR
jgi:leucyl aminopeptidase